jgi:hypothetical protein
MRLENLEVSLTMKAAVKIRVEDELKAFMQDEEFRRRIIRAYEVQVEGQGGWGFTVRYKGYRIRFDIDDNASRPGLTVYVGYALEKPKPQGRQLTLLEVSA